MSPITTKSTAIIPTTRFEGLQPGGALVLDEYVLAKASILSTCDIEIGVGLDRRLFLSSNVSVNVRSTKINSWIHDNSNGDVCGISVILLLYFFGDDST